MNHMLGIIQSLHLMQVSVSFDLKEIMRQALCVCVCDFHLKNNYLAEQRSCGQWFHIIESLLFIILNFSIIIEFISH